MQEETGRRPEAGGRDRFRQNSHVPNEQETSTAQVHSCSVAMLPAQPAAPARGSPARGSPARGSLLGDSIPVGWDAARWNALIQQEQFDDDDIRQVVNYYPHSIDNFTKADLAATWVAAGRPAASLPTDLQVTPLQP